MRPQCRRGFGNFPSFPETHWAVTELWEQHERSRGGSRTGCCWGLPWHGASPALGSAVRGWGRLEREAFLVGKTEWWRAEHQCGWRGLSSALDPAQAPLKGSLSEGFVARERPRSPLIQAIPHLGHPWSRPSLLFLSLRIRAAAAQHGALRASSGEKLSCPLTCSILQCHFCSPLALQVGWKGFCSAGHFLGRVALSVLPCRSEGAAP